MSCENVYRQVNGIVLRLISPQLAQSKLHSSDRPSDEGPVWMIVGHKIKGRLEISVCGLDESFNVFENHTPNHYYGTHVCIYPMGEGETHFTEFDFPTLFGGVMAKNPVEESEVIVKLKALYTMSDEIASDRVIYIFQKIMHDNFPDLVK